MLCNRNLAAAMCVVLASVAYPSVEASEPNGGLAGWWHGQSRKFAKRHNRAAAPPARPAVATRPAVAARRPVRAPVPARTAYYRPAPRPVIHRAAARRVLQPQVPANRPPPTPAATGYVRLNSPLYPAPRQNIPVQVGGVVITNPVLAPHEFLYPHEYKALYPPFYYRVKGSYLWTPFGMESHDKWELTGTEVRVRYESKQHLIRRLTRPFIEPFRR